MHRSGTSLVCQLLFEAGAGFGNPDRFLPSDRWNSRGYFELRSIIDMNSKLITGLPRTASPFSAALSQGLYMLKPPQSRIDRRAAALAGEISGLGVSCSDLTVKDPRFCLTLGAWLKYTEIDRIVICLRHPMQVADSLRRRQHVPRSVALRFWAYHIRALLNHAPLEKCGFFDVDKLIAGNGREEFGRVLEFLGMPVDRARQASILDDVYQTHLIRAGNARKVDIPGEVGRLWDRITGIAESRCGPKFVGA